MNRPSLILAIESSCDETAASIFFNDTILSNVIATQKVHESYGGVVPEIASRAHMENLIPVVQQAINNAGIDKHEITAVAFTQAPGLIGSLLVGACFAKAMAQSLEVPLIAVNHMQAHVLAHFIDDPKPQFPFLCLTVSGGHTQLVICKNYLEMEVVGTTIDDAAGEAFDKIAKMLNFPYPGGPFIDQYAALGNELAFSFPISNMEKYNYSFSGLKTSVLYFLQKQLKSNPHFVEEHLNDICASVQKTIIDTLMKKLKAVAKDYNVKNIGIAGGVSANKGLRKALQDVGNENDWNVFIPKFEYCTDNAAMIGITAYYKFINEEFSSLDIVPSARQLWSHG